jgi:hypothetical protein
VREGEGRRGEEEVGREIGLREEIWRKKGRIR